MIILVLVWALAATWLAIRKGFFRLPIQNQNPTVTALQFVGSFLLYALFAIVISLLLIVVYRKFSSQDLESIPTLFLTFVHFVVRLGLFGCLIWFFYEQNPTTLRMLWKNKFHHQTRSSIYDFGIGALTWFLSFPLVSIVAEIVDKFLKYFFHYEYVDQNAVKFVKLAVDSPLSLAFVLISILVLAPLVEEFLFRGVLQTFLKRWMGRVGAIILAAVCFALFHFSTAQGLANFSLLIPLFILGTFLGFLYEKQGSLWAPIGLHAVFNLVTALRIIFLQESV